MVLKNKFRVSAATWNVRCKCCGLGKPHKEVKWGYCLDCKHDNPKLVFRGKYSELFSFKRVVERYTKDKMCGV